MSRMCHEVQMPVRDEDVYCELIRPIPSCLQWLPLGCGCKVTKKEHLLFTFYILFECITVFVTF